MDLYSAAKRMTRPFRFSNPASHREVSLASRGLIGDGITCALVRPDGVIDWLCFPRFDSPSVFAGLLDEVRGGFTGILPATWPFESLQRYDPDTNVLETLFRVERQGVVRLIDYMPWTNDPRSTIHEVHRRIECVEGSLELNIIFDPRFRYGESETRVTREEHGLVAHGARGERMVAVLSGEVQWEPYGASGLRTRIRLDTGERRWMVLGWDAERPAPIAAYRPFEQLRATRQAWREWSRQFRYEGPWRDNVLRSALALKLLMYAPTGAMVAAPTTSLPEWIGGPRNWDYRFSWVRDAAMAVRATNLIGYPNESREFFYFVRDTLKHGDPLQVMYSLDGGPVPEERILSHLVGFQGSTPVRIGNAARDQLQFDTAGALLDAAYLYERFGGRLPLRTWRLLKAVILTTARRWREPDHGIWEPRREMRHNVHSKLMCWLALHRGRHLARLFAEPDLLKACTREAELIRSDILRHGVDPSGKHFVGAYGSNEPDAALLLLPIVGCFEARDPLVQGTIDWLREELKAGPFLRRYRTDDGLTGPEGAFLLCGFWLAEALALANRLEEAEKVFVVHAEAANHLGLLAEEVHPLTREQLGNFPQAFSHLGLINAAARIDLALRMRDEGQSAPPYLVDP
ncbi:glycoside hydrolase family 15 protein [Archangium violaceum]|uniref:glycoside hydrolase family 15 protein n=1 Tax=Archangium violaceum TaxID=83451 RepID=UPI00194F43CF|nr:glycoside hydrolase family 15 protein [Archangium violaceum]QRO01062.1 glycoside hydrolase family 15 protein [Archangium violaceum]